MSGCGTSGRGGSRSGDAPLLGAPACNADARAARTRGWHGPLGPLEWPVVVSVRIVVANTNHKGVVL